MCNQAHKRTLELLKNILQIICNIKEYQELEKHVKGKQLYINPLEQEPLRAKKFAREYKDTRSQEIFRILLTYYSLDLHTVITNASGL